MKLAIEHRDFSEMAGSERMAAAVNLGQMQRAMQGQSAALTGINQSDNLTDAEKRKYSNSITAGMGTTALGVTSDEEDQTLIRLGVTFIQPFYIFGHGLDPFIDSSGSPVLRRILLKL